MKGRTEQEHFDRVEDAAADDAGRPGWGERRRSGKHGSVREQTMVMEQVLASENLHAAWRRVKANAGAPGIDGMTIEAFPEFVREQWPISRSILWTRNSNAAGTVSPATPTTSSSW